MDELITRISAKTGLPADQAKNAADAVLAFLKEKLPAGLGEHLDGLLAGGGGSGGLGNIAETLGGLFGKKG
jgi:hypothetical protein